MRQPARSRAAMRRRLAAPESRCGPESTPEMRRRRHRFRRGGDGPQKMNAHLDLDLPSPATPPPPPAAGEAPPAVELRALDTLWFQVGGTLCNLACTHCFVS